MINNTLKEIIVNFWERLDFLFYERNFYIPELSTNKAISLIWPRQVAV